MTEIPRDPAFDSTLALLRDGYRFIDNRCRRLNTDIFETRLMLQKAICITGAEAAALFYDPALFRREGAAPRRVQKTLQGVGGVQGLDGPEHRHRKELFMAVMTTASIDAFLNALAEQWQIAVADWQRRKRIVLFDEAQVMLCRAACAWAGIPLSGQEARRRAGDLGTMVDALGAIGPRYWHGRLARHRAERWIVEVIERTRQIAPPNAAADRSPLAHFARYRDLDGELLDSRIAAVDLLNLIRPITAIATYVAFAALALQRHPEWRRRLQASGSGDDLEHFVHEVRRFYPFTPMLGARVRKPFDWQGWRFEPDTLVILDVYGILHDGRLWDRPDEFRPERFRNWRGSPFDFIPQGGGDHFAGHRCAGEWITIAVLKQAVHRLTNAIAYDVPADQDLDFSLARIPTRPRSGFEVAGIRAVG